MKFSELNLDPRLNAAIEKLGYADTTPIQEQTMPHILAGKDVAGLAQTGTGKTAAFVIPLIERILRAETDPENERAFKDWKAFNSILILVPTRELAEQIHENIVKLGEGTGVKSYPLYGGTGYDKQKEALKNGLQFIVSTPGRLIDLYKEHFVDFKNVKAIVFDEADRMFDMGFKDDMKYILSRIERTRQLLVFSATLNFDVLNTIYQFGSEPVEINISRDQAKAENVKDAIYHIGNEEKPQHLLSVIKKENPRQTIIFTNFKNAVDRIAHFLTHNNVPAMGISSLMSQAQRNQVIAKFKADNNQNVLVATDVAARGLDIVDVDLVINYEMPQDAESYVHRIGRTGRAGKEGKAFSFISEKDVESLTRVEEYTKKKIDVQYLEDGDLVKEFDPMSAGQASFKKSFDRDRKPGGPGGRRGPGFDRKNDRRPGARPPRGDRAEFKGGEHRGEPKGDLPAGAVDAAGAPPQGGKPHSKPRHERDRNEGANGQHRGPKGKNPNQGQTPSKHFKKDKPFVPKSAGGQYRKNGSNQGVGAKIKSFLKRIFS